MKLITITIGVIIGILTGLFLTQWSIETLDERVVILILGYLGAVQALILAHELDIK